MTDAASSGETGPSTAPPPPPPGGGDVRVANSGAVGVSATPSKTKPTGTSSPAAMDKRISTYPITNAFTAALRAGDFAGFLSRSKALFRAMRDTKEKGRPIVRKRKVGHVPPREPETRNSMLLLQWRQQPWDRTADYLCLWFSDFWKPLQAMT